MVLLKQTKEELEISHIISMNRKKNNIPTWTIFIKIFVTAYANILCNPDFQGYTISSSIPLDDGFRSLDIPSDAYCWFARNQPSFSVVEVNEISFIGVTNSLNLKPDQSVYVCQMLALDNNSIYQLTGVSFLGGQTQKGSLKVLLNDNRILKIELDDNQRVWPFIVTFTTTQISNQLCFQSLDFEDEDQKLNVGVLVDDSNTTTTNTTTTNTTNTTTTITNSSSTNINVLVSIVINIKESQGIVQFQTDLEEVQSGLIQYMQGNFSFSINKEEQKQHCQFTKINQKVIIIWTPTKNYKTSDFSMKFPIYQGTNGTNYSFSLTFNKNQLFFMYLSSQEKYFLEKLDPAIKSTTEQIVKGLSLISNIFCSYFILRIINFWNFALFYYFLHLETIPKFTDKAMVQMLNILVHKSSLLNWITSILGKNNIKNLGMLTEVQKVRNQMKHEKLYFYNFGFTSNFINNNIDALFLLFILAVKVMLIKMLRWVCAQLQMTLFLQILGNKSNDFNIIGVEFIVGIPFMIVPMIFQILNAYFYCFHEKVNAFLNISCLFFCIILPASSFVLALRKQSRKLFQKKIKKSRLRQEKDRERITLLKFEYLDLFFCPILPTLLVFHNPLVFICLVGGGVLWKFVQYFRRLSTISNYQKIMNFISSFVWLIYHAIFVIFEIGRSENVQDLMLPWFKYCGFAALLLIVFGGVWEFLRFLIQSLVEIISIFRRYCKKKSNKNSIAPQNQQKPSDLENIQNFLECKPQQTQKESTQIKNFNHQNPKNKAQSQDQYEFPKFYLPFIKQKQISINKNKNETDHQKTEKETISNNKTKTYSKSSHDKMINKHGMQELKFDRRTKTSPINYQSQEKVLRKKTKDQQVTFTQEQQIYKLSSKKTRRVKSNKNKGMKVNFNIENQNLDDQKQINL